MGEPADLGVSDGGGHIPVLVREVVDWLAVRAGGTYLDVTVGGGGHAVAVLEASAPDGRLLGLDRDPEAVRRATERLSVYGDRVSVVHASYRDLLEIAHLQGCSPADGVLFDLGFSSWQIDSARRGFAFSAEGPLDMRYDPSTGATAADLVNDLSEMALADLLFRYGEEARSRQIARAIVAARPIYTTLGLAELIERVVGGRRSAIHPATRTFQALRIAVNEELAALESALPDAVKLLRAGGRLAVIAFHSLEDRIVKQFVQQSSRDCICPPDYPVCTCNHKRTLQRVTRKPITPSQVEIAANPRSRSAKLRVAEKL